MVDTSLQQNTTRSRTGTKLRQTSSQQHHEREHPKFLSVVNLMEQAGNREDGMKKMSPSSRFLTRFLCSIQFRTIVILVCLFLLMMGGFLAILLSIFSTNSRNLEKFYARETQKRVNRALYDRLALHSTVLDNYGNWDMTYDAVANFTSERMDEYLASNYYFEYVRDIHLANYCVFYFLNGTRAAWVGYDLKTGNSLPLLPELESLPPHHPLLTNNLTTNFNADNVGYMYTSANVLYFLFAQPIRSELRGPLPGGILVYAVAPDEDFVKNIAVRAQSCVTMFSSDLATNPAIKSKKSQIERNRGTVITWDNSVWTDANIMEISVLDAHKQVNVAGRQCWLKDNGNETTSEKTISSYQVFTDMYGKNNLVLRADMKRDVYVLGLRSFGWAYGMVSLGVVITSIVMILYIERAVLSPIIKLTYGVSDIAKLIDRGLRLKVDECAQDEISILTKKINTMLGALDSSNKKLAYDHERLQILIDKISIEEQRARAVMDGITDFILTVDCLTGIIISANKSFYQQLLFDPSTTEGVMPLSSALTEFKTDELMQKLESLCSTGKTFDTFMDCRLKDPTPVLVTCNRVKLYSGDQVLDVYIVLARNMEEQNRLRALLHQQQDENQNHMGSIFDSMMANEEQRALFREFCHKEMSLENFEFLEVVANYKSFKATHDRILIQQEIVETYLLPNSPKELNIAHRILSSELFQIQKGRAEIDIFDKLVSSIRAMMINDTFSRFMSHNGHSQ